MTDNLLNIRKSFENWYTDGKIDCPSIERVDGKYKLMNAYLSWVAYQAGWIDRGNIGEENDR